MPFHIPIQFQGILSTITLLDVLDILIVALILYKLYMMLQDTRAITLVKARVSCSIIRSEERFSRNAETDL